MEPRLTVRALWGARDDQLDESAGRVNETFNGLAAVTKEWSNWFRGYKSLADREHGPLFLVGRPDLIRQEMSDRQREAGWEGMPELGYSLTAAAGPPRGKGLEASFLRLRCCARLSYPGCNSIVLQLPIKKAALALYDVRVLARVVMVFREVWDPDWACASYDLTEIVPPPWECGPVLGWATYLAPWTGVVEAGLAPGWHWFPQRASKQILIFEDGPPDPNNREHVSSFLEMASRIRWTPPSSRPSGGKEDGRGR